VHVEQWREDPLFALKYCAEWFRHGYHENPFEKVAYARQREYAARKPKSASPRP
jgi:predicted alpha/beta-hydrolase family hydrolase